MDTKIFNRSTTYLTKLPYKTIGNILPKSSNYLLWILKSSTTLEVFKAAVTNSLSKSTLITEENYRLNTSNLGQIVPNKSHLLCTQLQTVSHSINEKPLILNVMKTFTRIIETFHLYKLFYSNNSFCISSYFIRK